MEEDQNETEPPNSDPLLNQQTPEIGNVNDSALSSLNFEYSSWDVCVLCAAGAVSSIVLRSSLGTFTRREGHFEIMSLTPTDKPGSFFASFADTNTGRVFGGVVVGSLIASGPLHLNVSDFKQSKEILKKNSANSSASGNSGSEVHRMLLTGESSGSSSLKTSEPLPTETTDHDTLPAGGGVSDNVSINPANAQNMNSASQNQ
ncbi:unnamed protein product [Trifolium pratense]|uniref:Uncharacterized protein n=1 Tax=Trifolium pratense TaxID=57577 RepID=A0ACB0KV76_TRIPR|nr:unnamed protein product [Trifolium pratense]